MTLEPWWLLADMRSMGSFLEILFGAGLAAAVVLVFWLVFSFSDDLTRRGRTGR
jgi:hypothetical protein